MRVRIPVALAMVLVAGAAQASGLRELQAEAAPVLNVALPWRLSPAGGATDRTEERSWYGYQLILSDVVSLAIALTATFAAFVSCPFVIFGSSPTPSSGCYAARGVGLASLGSFLVAPAIIHLAHGRLGAAGGSLALRIAAPIAVGLFTGFPPACLVALLVGVVIDDAFLSSEPRTTAQESRDYQPEAWPLSQDH